jgi:predicted metal-dependent peptidase
MDAISELEQRASRHRAEEEAAEAYSTALTRLLRGKINDSGDRNMASCAFFATLAMRLKRQPDWDIPTAVVNGRTLKYNPDWLLSLSADERVAVLAHEVLHCSNAHHVRRRERDNDLWNIAADLSINGLLKDTGFQMPQGVLYAERQGFAEGLSAEEYYDQLPYEPHTQGDDPGGCGGVDDGAADEAGRRQQEAEWKIATAQAAQMAGERGEMSGGLERFVQSVTAPQVDWRAELREFVNSHAKKDYAWVPPNRRFVHMGLYLPSLHSDELGDVVVACDCSGSIGEDDLARFAGEIEEIAAVAQCRVTVLYHDSRVLKVQEWEPTDGPLKLTPVGGGGTNHRPVFEWIDRLPEPTCVVCLTDLASRFPDRVPSYPVLWATDSSKQGPFGRTIRIRRN